MSKGTLATAMKKAAFADLVRELEESQSLLVAMLHEQRPEKEIEDQIIANRAALTKAGVPIR